MKLADGYELDPAVPLSDLRPHPKNPNQGDVGAIVESIETVGFYGTVTAQKPRNGRKHGRILAGEHRWRAAQAENADTIPVSWLDVDDKALGGHFELCWSKWRHQRLLARILWSGLNGMAGDDTTSRVHPTQKPVKLVRWFFDRYKGDTVLDLFAGSGPVVIACEDTGRTALLIEKDRRYCDLIAKRWADYTGETPELNGTPRPIE